MLMPIKKTVNDEIASMCKLTLNLVNKKTNAQKVLIKLDKKKKQLDTLKEKINTRKKPTDRKGVKTVKSTSTPRYKREELKATKKPTRNTDGRTDKAAKPYSKGNAKPNARTNPKSNTNTKKRAPDTFKSAPRPKKSTRR